MKTLMERLQVEEDRLNLEQEDSHGEYEKMKLVFEKKIDLYKNISSEKATYVFISKGNVREGGKLEIVGFTLYETNSTGKLAFLDNMITVFKTESDEIGDLISKEWEWK